MSAQSERPIPDPKVSDRMSAQSEKLVPAPERSDPNSAQDDSTQTRADGELEPWERDRLWEYRNHQEDILYRRIEVFLVAESLLFVAFAFLAGKGPLTDYATGAIAVLGTTLTAIWFLAVTRQRAVFRFAQKLAEDAHPWYKRLRAQRTLAEKKGWLGYISGQNLITYSIPILTLGAWVVSLIPLWFPQEPARTIVIVGGAFFFLALVVGVRRK